MFAEKVCKQVVGFSAMAEDEMFEVNGGYQADAAAGTMGGSKKDEGKDWAYNYGIESQNQGWADITQGIASGDYGLVGQGIGEVISGKYNENKYNPAKR